jgi:lipopolysaccharide/colanic/teichoic acid biosynthesis glycosyltransferase
MSLAGQNTALACKRLFDVIVAAMALIFLSPLIALIALAIKLDDRGPVFFIQDRVGRGRKNFRCYKFRTMIVGAQKIGNKLTVTADDERITRVGRLLRNWTLDEIPQLINVLKGDMSIVGPRPWVPAQAAYCSSEDSRRFDFKPGMAGLAWINGRNRLSWDERVRMDLCYVDHWSLLLDFSILLKAAVLLFRRDGVYFAESRERGAGSTGHGAGSTELRLNSSAVEREASEVASQISKVGKSGELEVSKGIRVKRDELRETL